MKKLLIISDADSKWIQQYCKYLAQNCNFKIYILTRNYNKFQDFYRQNGIEIIHYVRSYDGGKERLYKFLLRAKHQVKEICDNFDAIHVHFVDRVVLTLANAIATRDTRVIVSYWGSDIYRKKEQAFINEKKELYRADKITLITEDMHEKFKNYYNNEFENKIEILDFGISVIDEIDKLDCHSEDRQKYRDNLGIQKNEIAIAVGYNGIREQQHLEVVKSLNELDFGDKKNLHIYIHMGYGASDDLYMKELNDELLKLGCKYTISKKFMDESEIARLRFAMDIFINAQTTDALSASMLEYLYAGCIVLNPEWLKYDFLKENKIYNCIYKDFQDLPQKLQKVLFCNKNIEEQIEHTKQIIFLLYSWEKIIEKWQKLYQ